MIIDTLSRAMAGMEENSAKDMSAAIAGLATIERTLDCAVTGDFHDTGKDVTRGERGSTSLRAAAEASVEVSAEGQGDSKVVTATAAKQRDSADGATFTFRLRQVELGRDKWGLPRRRPAPSSCSAKRKLPSVAPRRNSGSSPYGNATGLEALRDAAERAGRRITNSPDYPSTRRIVTEEAWREEIYRRAFSEDTKPDTMRCAFRRAREDLVAAGLVAGYAGSYWTVQL